jgi:hypothetical protein
MAHPLVLALFESRDAATAAGQAVQALGIPERAISVVARTHQEEGALARVIGGTPGSEIEDSRPAARVGELGGIMIAAAAMIMPGIGSVVAAGPLAAELGDMMGHLAGGLADILEGCGVAHATAARWQEQIERGAILLGVHVVEDVSRSVAETLRLGGADDLEIAVWAGDLP